jgi:hypothetical protein
MLTTTTSPEPEDEPSRPPARSGRGAASVIPHLHEHDPMVIADRNEAMRDHAGKSDSDRELEERSA